MVYGRVQPVGEHQRQGVRIGHTHLPDQDQPVPVGQQGVDDRNVDPVQVYLAGIGY